MVMATHLQATPGLTVSQESIALGECRHIRFTVRNNGDEPVTSWQLSMRLPNFVLGMYGAQVDAVTHSEYRITPTRWEATLAPRKELTFGVILSAPEYQPTAA